MSQLPNITHFIIFILVLITFLAIINKIYRKRKRNGSYDYGTSSNEYIDSDYNELVDEYNDPDCDNDYDSCDSGDSGSSD